ncbi:MAG: ribonuclease H-like domain-containing protein [Sporolactobacillus sp.]
MSLKQKLQLYKKQLHEAQSLHSEQKSRSVQREEGAADREIFRAAGELDAAIRRLDDQYVLVHTEKLSLDRRIGPYTARDLFRTMAAWQQASTDHPLSAEGLHASDLLFFDTETTGLGSGTGQMIFLIGLARIASGSLEMRQYFLPGPGHEAAFYDAFLRDTQSLKNLVTFNGKAFDWPRVKTRYQFVRERVPLLPAFGHFDLLHASRRLWKRRLESVRLQTIEEKILSMGRKEDVPGKMAPFLYFQFLKKPEAGLVKGIIEHNREDVLTLIALYIHLSDKILGLRSSDPEEIYEIAHWFAQLGERQQAEPLFERIAREGKSFSAKAKAALAHYAKQSGDYERARVLLHQAIDGSAEQDDALYIEAAKIEEHQFKNYEKALLYTQSAMTILSSRTANRGADLVKMASYQKRLNRLDQKFFNPKKMGN